MSKKDQRDPHAVIVIRQLLQIIDLGMIEDLQQSEDSQNVARNLEIAETLKAKKGKNFISRSTDKINKILHKSGSQPIFNHPLIESNVHRISVLLDYLRKYVSSEGIFRISGNKKRQDELKHLMNKDVEINFDESSFTEHDVASVFKQFLAELPEPIIIAAHIKIHMQVIDLGRKEKQIKALQLLFLLIPPENRHLLQLLLGLLHEIANNQENKMSTYNLALVFAPSVMLYKHRSTSCLSAVPEDLTTFTDALAFMIDHENEIFAIPEDLLQEIEEHKASSNAQNSDTLVASQPFCAQVDTRRYHTTAKKNTADALVDLYAQVSQMEDTPMKRQFLKRFAETHPGTPPFKPKTKKGEEENTKTKFKKSNDEEPRTSFTTPKILSPRFANKSRLPLQNVNASCSETESLCDSPTGTFRSLQTPHNECRVQSKTGECNREDISLEPPTPSGHFFKFSTPGSMRNPFKRKRRTKSIGSSSESNLHFLKSSFPKPRRTSSSSQLETAVHVEPVTLTKASRRCKGPVVTPVIKKSLIARDIRSLYTTPMNSRKSNTVPFSAK